MMNGSRATFPELSAEEARRKVDLSALQQLAQDMTALADDRQSGARAQNRGGDHD
jgi:hypothetical protein